MPGPPPGREEHQNPRLHRRSGQRRAPGGPAGPAGGCPQALGLLEGLDTRLLIADTSYDSDANRAHCAEKGIAVVIPNRPTRTEPLLLDEDYYRGRNKIERFFGPMKQCRRLATRDDKTAVPFLAFWHIAAALDWLR